MSQLKLVSDYWGKPLDQSRPTGWLGHPITRSYLRRRLSGHEDKGAVSYWKERYFAEPAERALVIGCGFGSFEREVVRSEIAKTIDANDISEGAIAACIETRDKAGLTERINYSVEDANTFTIEQGRYNAIFGISSVHHISDLDHLFKQCRNGLADGGLLFMDEYIGPSRFQSDDFVVKIINEVRAILPEKYRRLIRRNDGSVVTSWSRPSIKWFDDYDPSEAVRSAEILPVLNLYFDVLEVRPYGGAILHHLLSGISGNFDPEIEEDATILRLLTILERSLEEAGAINSDFAAIVAKPRR